MFQNARPFFCTPAGSTIVFLDVQNVLNVKYQVRPTYDFWNDEVETEASIGILPTIGISAEF